MKQPTFSPKTDVEHYLNNDFNIGVYDDLTGNGIREGWEDTFEPLHFFNLLYSEYENIKANTDKPLSIVKHLKSLKHTDEQQYFFLWVLKDLLRENETLELKRCLNFIKIEFDKLQTVLFPKEETVQIKNAYDFEQVKKHIETLPDASAKIKYLTEIKTDYNQSNNDLVFWEIGKSFSKKCELEIKKLKELLSIENTNTSHKPIDKLQWKKDSALLAYLFNELKNKGIIEDKNVWQKLTAFFIDKDGKEFKNTDFPNYITSYTKGKTAHDGKKVPKEHAGITDILTILFEVTEKHKK